MEEHIYKPQSLMSFGYDPKKSEGAGKLPVFLNSTFVSESALQLKNSFDIKYGLREPGKGEEAALVYGRINDPDKQVFEERFTKWESGAEACVVFGSGMAAGTTVCSEFSEHGGVVFCSDPLYGGTNHYLIKMLSASGVKVVFFDAKKSQEEIIDMIYQLEDPKRLSLILTETPANPTNDLFDIEQLAEIARMFSTKEKKVMLAVDNTFLGPIFQSPLDHGADLVIYSLTKYVGGHGDLIAGAVLGNEELINRLKARRTFLGNMADPLTCWLLLRSLDTLHLRMRAQSENAQLIAQYLSSHPLVEKMYYLGNIEPGSRQYDIKVKQCKSNGGVVSFDISGGWEAAFKFLDSLELISLAVSLGSTKSLAQSPFFMTHADVDIATKKALSINENMVRLSVGVEDPDDLIYDIDQALKKAAMRPIQTLNESEEELDFHIDATL